MRKKITIAFLASLCFLSLPVLTFANSRNYLTKESFVKQGGAVGYSVSEKSGHLRTERDPISLTIIPEGEISEKSFTIRLENAHWAPIEQIILGAAPPGGYMDDDGNLLFEDGSILIQKESITETVFLSLNEQLNSEGPLKITRVSDQILEIESSEVIVNPFSIPIFATVTKGTATLYVEGNDSGVSDYNQVLAKTPGNNDIMFEVLNTNRNISTFYDRGYLTEFTIKETYKGAFNVASENQREIFMYIDHPDFVFDSSMMFIVLSYGKGLLQKETIPVSFDRKDPQILKFTIPEIYTGNYETVSVSEVMVMSKSRYIQEGDLIVDIEGDAFISDRLILGYIKNYGLEADIRNGYKDVVAGKSTNIKIDLFESVPGSIIEDRDMFFELSDGSFGKYNKESNISKIDQLKRFVDTSNSLTITDVEINKDDEFIGFSARVTKNNSSARKIPISFTYNAPINFEGNVELYIEGRAIDNPVSIRIAKSYPGIELNSKLFYLQPGLKNQVGGELIIRENERGMLERGNISILVDKDEYIRFEKLPKIEVSEDSGMKIGEMKKIETKDRIGISFEITRSSRQSADIYIYDFDLTTSRMIADGRVDVFVSGSSIGLGDILVDDLFYIKEGSNNNFATPEVQYPLNVAQFIIGANTYIVNGNMKQMDATPYLSSKNRTMLPIRYIADAFNISDNNIGYDKGIVTITQGNNIIKLTEGSNLAVANNEFVLMDEPVVIKEGRAYVPVGEIGRIMGLKVEWDNNLRAAKFSNQ